MGFDAGILFSFFYPVTTPPMNGQLIAFESREGLQHRTGESLYCTNADADTDARPETDWLALFLCYCSVLPPAVISCVCAELQAAVTGSAA
jgi:hypothetical protein